MAPLPFVPDFRVAGSHTGNAMPSRNLPGPWQNSILARLDDEEMSRLQNDLALVSLLAGEVLETAGELPSEVYFPTTCIVSLIATTRNGSSVELAMIGNEGLAGNTLVLGGAAASHKTVVQASGEAYRLKAETMNWALSQGGNLQRLALRHTQLLLTQMAQNFLCARHHSSEQQLCRWLLRCLDRRAGDRISMTQERIANLLGLRREAITDSAGRLQAAGLIHYRRGEIIVIDRAGLEAQACECHGAIKLEETLFLQSTAAGAPPSRFHPNPATLRQRAESRWRDQQLAPLEGSFDAAGLQHELEIRKIELEINNEALHQAYDEADALGQRYADIYDFAPIGYFTLDALGNILELNLAGAILLGLKRSQKSRYRFVNYLSPENQAEFTQFVDGVLHEKNTGFIEIALAASALRPASIVRIEAVPDEDGKECRMVLMDITEQRNALLALERSEMRYRQFIANLPLGKGIARNNPHNPD